MKKQFLFMWLLSAAAMPAFAQEKPARMPLEMLLNRDGKVEIPANLNAVVETRGWDMRLQADGSPVFTRNMPAFHPRQLHQPDMAPRAAASSHPDDQYWDDQFSLRGTNGSVFVLKTVMGNIYIGGQFTTVGKTVARNVAMWDGTSWHSLGTGAENGVNADVQAIEADGSNVYVAGSFSKAGSVTANKVARWDGSAWHSLGTGLANGVDGFYVTSLALKAPQQLFIGGSFSTAGGQPASNVAFWDGSSWSGVGGGTNATVWSMNYIDDKLFIGGGFDTAGTAPIQRIAYFHQGSWHDMGGANDWVTMIAQGAMNEVLFGGFFDTISGQQMNHIARYDLSAQTWQPLGTGTDVGTNGPVRSAFHSFGTYYLAGNFDMAGGVPVNNVAIHNFAGFQPIGVGADNVVRGLGRDAMGRLVLGGSFTTAGDSLSYGLATADFDPFDMTIPPVWNALTPGTHNGSDGGIAKAIVANGELYVAGLFNWLGTGRHANVAKWNGSQWVALADGIDGIVNDIVWHNNELYAGGYFAVQQGPIWSPLIARWNGTAWQAVGQGIGGSVASQVFALESDGTSLYVAGIFLEQAANPNGSVVNISNIARWDGSNWHALDSGIEMGGMVQALKWHQGDLYAGGMFGTAGSQPVNNLAKWDGTSWNAVGSGVNGSVYALASDTNVLYAGGEFETAGTATVNNLAQWDGTNWSTVGNGVALSNGGMFNAPYVTALLPHAGGLYVGGHFDQAGTQTANGVAYYNGSSWSGLGSGLGDGAVRSFAVHQGKLFSTGTFYIAGAKASSAIGSFGSMVSGVQEQQLQSIGVYPNPASGMVWLQVPGSQPAQLQVFDMAGRLCLSYTLAPGTQQLDIANLAAGVYQLRMQLGEEKATQKLVIVQ